MPIKKPIPRGRNGGRKPKYSEPTVTRAYRVPKSMVKYFDELNKQELIKLEVK